MHIILQFLQSSSKEVFFYVFPPLFYSHSVKFFSSSLAFSDHGKERAVLGSGSQSTDWVNFWPDTPRCKQNLLGRSMENFALGMLMFGFRDSKLEEECCTSLFKILLWTGKAEKKQPHWKAGCLTCGILLFVGGKRRSMWCKYAEVVTRQLPSPDARRPSADESSLEQAPLHCL